MQGTAYDAKDQSKGYVQAAQDKVSSFLGQSQDKAGELGDKAKDHAEGAKHDSKSASFCTLTMNNSHTRHVR